MAMAKKKFFRSSLNFYFHQTQKIVYSTLVLSTLCLGQQSIHAYDVIDRFKLIDDKLKTENMLRPLGHDFLIDINASLNKNVLDFIDDVEKAANTTGDTNAKLAAANVVLTKYDKTEQTAKVNFNLGIPIFSFTTGNTTIKPNLRVSADFGTNVGVRSEILDINTILDLFSDDIPDSLESAIRGSTFLSDCAAATTDGSPYGANNCDIIQYCKNGSTSVFPIPAKAYCATQAEGKYIIPANGQAVPNLALFARLDVKAGLYNNFTSGEHYFGHLNIYGLHRTDIFQLVTSSLIASGQKIDLPEKENSEVTLQTDMKFGYKNSNYTASLGVEEIKITRLKDRDAASKAQSYGYDLLIRFHADANYILSILSLQPFLGVHKRSGYGFGDGAYLGADSGMYVWGDRLGLMLRGMVDKQYFTLTPRLRLWFMQLEYSAKAPMKSTDGDVKLSAIHSIDFRLFF